MKLFTSGRYAAVASTAALVVALGGTSYAAVQIGGGDIRDGSVGRADLARSAQVTVKQIHNDSGTTMAGGSNKTVLTMNVKRGSYLLSSKVNVYANSGGYAECWLTGPHGNTLDYGYSYAPSSGYGQVVDSAVISPRHTATVQLNCAGDGSTLDSKKLTATRVASVSDLTGVNVSKASLPRLVTPRR
jgi:hypothetical protein